MATSTLAGRQSAVVAGPLRKPTPLTSEGFGRRVKVAFPLERDSDNYPPFASESLWCRPLGDDLFEVDSIPFFARLVALADVVRAREGTDGTIRLEELIDHRGHCTIRIVPVNRVETATIRHAFQGLGCESEWSEQWGMVALDVPSEANLRAVRAAVEEGHRSGRWDYEEAALTDAWISAL